MVKVRSVSFCYRGSSQPTSLILEVDAVFEPPGTNFPREKPGNPPGPWKWNSVHFLRNLLKSRAQTVTAATTHEEDPLLYTEGATYALKRHFIP
jgi:hypothetical protein